MSQSTFDMPRLPGFAAVGASPIRVRSSLPAGAAPRPVRCCNDAMSEIDVRSSPSPKSSTGAKLRIAA